MESFTLTQHNYPDLSDTLSPIRLLEIYYIWELMLKLKGPEDSTIFYLQTWATRQLSKYRRHRIAKPEYERFQDYPDVCRCGKVFSEKGSRLRTHCSYCHGELFFISLHADWFEIPAIWKEYALARAIYHVVTRIPNFQHSVARNSRR